MAEIARAAGAGPEELVARVGARLAAGAVIALPTDTLYGLCADAGCAAAVAAVFAVKGRAEAQPLPLVVGEVAQARALLAEIPPWFERLAAAFWPGPLTLVARAAPGLPPALTAGTGTVALRQPAAPFLLAVLRASRLALTATSANRSGAPAAGSAAEVERQLGDRLELIVDGGEAPRRLPSTLVDLTGERPRILRPGAVAAERLTPFW